ncbi:hypothetical protein K6D04_001662 [Campylobacter jejuni]|uniref:Uncharacterized protein n=1 Tax=Campylobacter jejuni TaxID=197 RepID=A0A5T0TDW2_CAMJU|nr:hypothetical protein [Campylobacter jejuni]EAH7765161.1 hypothetical protein [Campylobacter coli]EAH5476052.1 hypothetical protein [Campylobacter jejuni]EAH5572823.1 hypothetical protein [Campylobacter jejuni]EAH5692316.1 hypothetical protein [Campylobacter jejuni]EAH6022683.1 hypothetical protein [Campylobacter jejuni]
MNILLRNDIDDLNLKEFKKFRECEEAFRLRGMKNKNQEIFVKRMAKGEKIIARISCVMDVKEKIKIEILKISRKEKGIKEEILFEESFFTNYHEKTQFHDFHGFRIYKIIKLFLRDYLKL